MHSLIIYCHVQLCSCLSIKIIHLFGFKKNHRNAVEGSAYTHMYSCLYCTLQPQLRLHWLFSLSALTNGLKMWYIEAVHCLQILYNMRADQSLATYFQKSKMDTKLWNLQLNPLIKQNLVDEGLNNSYMCRLVKLSLILVQPYCKENSIKMCRIRCSWLWKSICLCYDNYTYFMFEI